MFSPAAFLRVLSLLPVVPILAAPLERRIFSSRGTTTSTPPTPLSQETVNTEFLRPAQFSRVAYCSSQNVTAWTCGAPCEALGGGVEVLQAGGGMSGFLFPMVVLSF